MLEQCRIAPSKEQLFTERYAQLLAWALRLTNSHRASAEDLVQDAFIQFTLSNTSLDRIANVDGYLRRMLQYMHFSRISRRLSFSSMSDYDSLQSALQVPGVSDQLQARDELDQICRYACLRKETSRAGSVLILRFFHDYSPREIARIIGSTRHSVDEWQRVARRELKLYLREPNKLTFAGPSVAPVSFEHFGTGDDVAGALRRVIFQTRRGSCPSSAELRMAYQLGKCLGTQQLSHIVSCYQCLDSINEMLGLALLKDRHGPPPNLGNGQGFGPTGGSLSDDFSQAYHRKLEEIMDHRPRQLSVAIDGQPVGRLKISATENELELSQAAENEFDFLEVFGERGVRLLFMTPSDARDQEEFSELELSDARRLAVSIKPDTQHTKILLAYYDPTYRVPIQTVINPPLAKSKAGLVEVKTAHIRRLRCIWWRVQNLAKQFTATLPAGMRGAEASTDRATRKRGTESWVGATAVSNETASEMCSRLVALRSSRLILRPFNIALIVSLILSLGIFYWRSTLTHEYNGEELLRKASAAEVSQRDVIAHRVVSLEERRSSEGAVIARHRIEVWEDVAEGNQSQRLLDENANLRAARWKTRKGLSSFDEHEGLREQTAEVGNGALTAARIWHHVPSARGFMELAQQGVIRVHETPGSYLVTVDNSTHQSDGLIHASLTIRTNDLHATEQTLFVRLATETREYRFAEISFEEKNANEVSPSIFSPDKALLRSQVDRVALAMPADHEPHSHKPVLATPQLELEITYLLNQVGANQGEQVNIERLTNGTLRVQGIVDSVQRQQQILQALSLIKGNPAVTIEMAAIDKHNIARGYERTVSANAVEPAEMPDKLLVEDDLRRFVSRSAPESLINDEVRRLAARAVNRAYRSLFHAIELNSLVNRFTEAELVSMDVEARRKWLEMLHEHAAAVEREAKAFHDETGPVFSIENDSRATDQPELIENHRALIAAVKRLYLLSVANQESVCSAFTISKRQRSTDVRASQFWNSLASLEALASRIRRYPMKE
ncbi:MAG TPA: RNA polymerase sigma factor [Pyrinomonadaceae bacterium]|nr:RNA polymerase sigma factor [Pyrinomonadaceae bacterium]